MNPIATVRARLHGVPTWCFLSLALATAACGGGQDAKSPENSEESASSGGSSALGSTSAPAVGGGAPAPGDDAKKKVAPCNGFAIADLLSVISQEACEVSDAKPDAQQRDLKDVLEVKAVTDSQRIAPGATATVTVTFKNKGKVPLPLDFVVDPEPRFSIEVYTLKGGRVDAPHGAEPSLPPEAANASAPEPKIARVTLAQLGTARLTLKWDAVKYKWASKERAKGALPGHGYPKEAAGPLPPGTYALRVVTPLTGIFEGGEHEISQPRVQITVAK